MKLVWHGYCISTLMSDVKCAINDSGRQFDKLAGEIERYLSCHPEAADSVQGIVHWWLTQQRLEVAVNAVTRALELLEKNGVVEKYAGPGRVTWYRRRVTSR